MLLYVQLLLMTLVRGGDVSVYSGGTRQNNNAKLRFRPGSEFTITFLINAPHFRTFEVQYNGSHNSFMLGPNMINAEDVKDNRISFVDLSEQGVSTGMKIKLDSLTLRDDGAKFTYSYIDDDLNKDTGVYVLSIIDEEEERQRDKEELFVQLIYGCIVVVVVLVVVTTLVHLVKRGAVPLCLCRRHASTKRYSFTKDKEEENMDDSSLVPGDGEIV